MTISSLATYANETWKCDSRDGREITRITPHEMAARWTGSQCADYFCSTDRECSANYCIGWDGSIALNVDEDYRAWTSSSYDNDSRAITVEISNDDCSVYDMTDEAIEAFICLCVDLFQRYPSLGGRAVYTGDTDGNITFHRWFASTACPGDWFADRIEGIVDEINRRLEGDDEDMVTPREVWGYMNADLDSKDMRQRLVDTEKNAANALKKAKSNEAKLAQVIANQEKIIKLLGGE